MPKKNLNLFRRRKLAIGLALAYPWMRLFLLFCRQSSARGISDTLTVFQSYQVGDFYLALPAIRLLASRVSICVLCRPDCAFLLRQLGIVAIPFANPFFVEPSLRTFLFGLRQALALQSRLGTVALDFHADPRTAFLLKVIGARSVHSYQRPFGWFIDTTFRLAKENRHQSETDMAVAESFLNQGKSVTVRVYESHPVVSGAGKDLIISCWTRKDEKNWPLDSWQALIDALLLEGRTLCILVPPDGDQNFRAFHKRNLGRVEFLDLELEGVHERVKDAAGIVCTDNFLGHLGAYLGKPVFWINGSSDPEQVRPYGVGTEVVQVEPMPCRPCQHRCTNPVYKLCLLQLTPERVKDRLKIWLNGIPPQ